MMVQRARRLSLTPHACRAADDRGHALQRCHPSSAREEQRFSSRRATARLRTAQQELLRQPAVRSRQPRLPAAAAYRRTRAVRYDTGRPTERHPDRARAAFLCGGKLVVGAAASPGIRRRKWGSCCRPVPRRDRGGLGGLARPAAGAARAPTRAPAATVGSPQRPIGGGAVMPATSISPGMGSSARSRPRPAGHHGSRRARVASAALWSGRTTATAARAATSFGGGPGRSGPWTCTSATGAALPPLWPRAGPPAPLARAVLDVRGLLAAARARAPAVGGVGGRGAGDYQ